MHQVPREDQLELADAIAAGARRRPHQAFGEYLRRPWRELRAWRGLRRRVRVAGRRTPDSSPSRSHLRLPRKRPPRVPRRLQEAAAAERDHPAPERRSPLDPRANRRLVEKVVCPNFPTSSSTSKRSLAASSVASCCGSGWRVRSCCVPSIRRSTRSSAVPSAAFGGSANESSSRSTMTCSW